jgi:hypothetical protein
MATLIGIVIGAVAGFFAHALAMQVNFKQRTIDNKINVYDQLIAHWVRMRNFVYDGRYSSGTNVPPERAKQFDQMYGESQKCIGKAFLICEDLDLAESINTFNEKMRHAKWQELDRDATNALMEELKAEAKEVIGRMKNDIKESSRLSYKGDLWFMLTGRIYQRPSKQTSNSFTVKI